MSIITAFPRHQRTAATSVRPGLIEWSQPGEDLWVGRIHLDYAGMVELVDGDYVVTDWKNERIDICSTLDDAQQALEPATRVSVMENAERLAERTQWIASTTVTMTLVAAASIGGWLLTAA